MEWSEIKVKAPEHLTEALSSRLWELGVEGITELAAGELTAYVERTKVPDLTSRFHEYVQSVSEMNPGAEKVIFSIGDVEEKNWAENYRQYFAPRPLARFFYLVPEWVGGIDIPGGRIPIQMEAGEAFGTGLHPSTRLCLSLFERQGLTWPRPKQLRVLDVGTGSGILAIAAEKFGASEVVAIDNDPIAVSVARENAEKNHCVDLKVEGTPLADLKGNYDVILANILLEVHRELFPHYVRLLANDGRIIVSGLLAHQRQEIEEIALENGFSMEAVQTLQEWAAFSYHRSHPCDS